MSNLRQSDCRVHRSEATPTSVHVVVEQFDPAEQIAGGIHGFIVDLVRYAPPEHAFRIIGVDGTGSRKLGVWHDVTIGGRAAGFFPVARLSPARARRRVPHALRLVTGLLSRRPKVGNVILHAHRVEVGAALALAYPRNRLVQYVHTDSAEVGRHRVESFWRFHPGAGLWLERQAARRADQTIVMSGAAATRLSVESTRVSAGKNWFDDTVFYPPAEPSAGPLTVGWAGRLEPSKNPLDAVDVFARLAERNRDFRAWIAGSGTLEQELRERVSERGLVDCVEILGSIAPAMLAERLRRTDVLLVTSLWEGQPRVVVEALACGVPIVSVDVGDVRSLIVEGESGFVAKGRGVDELATLVGTATALDSRKEIALSISDHRASLIIPRMLDEFAHLSECAP